VYKRQHFGDWEVPLYYATILEEHEAVRSRAGMFDISHMGKFYLEGSGVLSYLEKLLPRTISAMKYGQALYMPLTNDTGGFVDDIIVYRIEEQRFFIIVNAANIEKDEKWFLSHKPADVTLRNLSQEQGLLALQGPAAASILEEAFPGQDFSKLSYYSFKVWGDGMVARTGYTGEDGFEIMVPNALLPEVWDKIFAAGEKNGIAAIGFGARDTLRLEAGMPLYGHDMNDSISPVEAKLKWAVDPAKNNYPGASLIGKQLAQGSTKVLVGFEMTDRGIPRQDYSILKEGKAVGAVTSGSFSPTLKKNIGMGYVPVELSSPGTEIEIQVRDKALKAQVVKLPFYKRKKI
jgi:aminomethyltransferase